MVIVKCLVWDLDNTLWDGVLCEDPVVTLNPRAADLLRRLDERGILHSIASRNDHDLAYAKLAQFGLAEYFLFPQIGWRAKSASVRAIAESLQFDLATMTFIDDSPVERHEVARALPMVRCYGHEHLATLADLPEFNPPVVTEDSAHRRLTYLAASRREASRSEFTGTDEAFIRSLNVTMTITFADRADIPRLSELTVRTTQMNATGIHYEADELRAMLRDGTADVLTVDVTDRFGPYGTVGMVMLTRLPELWHLRLLATSCRVVPLGVGAALLSWLAGSAYTAGTHLVGDFRRTERNRMMEIAYRFAGFDADIAGLSCACASRLAADEATNRFHLVPSPPVADLPLAVDAVTLEPVRRHAPTMSIKER
jgi:methoxymalonate biosynthesis protein